MASDPNALPESVVVSQFAGIRNSVSRERLGIGELEAAVNVDIDDVGQLRRRRGYVRKVAGNYHSLRAIAGRTLVVREGQLGTLNSNYAHNTLVEVGHDKLSYTAVSDTVYFSSRSASGKIVDGAVEPWGEPGTDRWVSPVIRPTATLGAISGKLLGAPPQATEIEYWNGRIYMAHEKLLWATELYLYDLLDKTKNYMPFEDEITMVAAVTDGMYVGTERQLFYMSGVLTQGLKRTLVLDAPVIRGSCVFVPTASVHPAARTGQPIPEGNNPVFLTGDGVCLGLDGGQVYNLTRGRVAFPTAYNAAALYREDQGANAYLAVTDSAGGPTANARIGDYVDAEIIRASQGG